MLGYVIRRLWQMIPTMAGVILLVFVLFNWVGGDPAYVLAGLMSSQEQIASIRKELGLDEPMHRQLWIFVQQVVFFDFGTSWTTGEKVSQIFATRLPASLTVVGPLLVIETLIGVVIAVAVAWLRGTWIDRGVMMLCTLGMSVSILVFIIVGQYWLAYRLNWFPVQGWGDTLSSNLLVYAPLPILLGLVVSIAPNTRLFRSFILDEIDQDYVRTARAKGMNEIRVMFIHVLRNALIPVITFVVSNLPGLLLGAFLLERFFGIPGVGREIILAVERSDFPVIKAVTVYVALATMIFNLIGDLLYRLADPRIQLK
ncbi:MAG: ABC transporter permease [Betaproteobacteria bacterium]|nr:ABC transporter permease [Pseudomonadota bacterium]NBO11773.1 ABC transporter permease [Betaproteobacteria bacterium]NBO44362.1 ABC transporter permease [Betaproteobacteria bacterium]NBP09636.1 ABC transporter permease [Betaproteobacteria bacterium]NBP62678.1 ABC transporter permease [Betaproteobacteria bacterium]